MNRNNLREKASRSLNRLQDAIWRWAQVQSPWLLHYNSGSCNGCDIELLATLTPHYDIERLGMKLVDSPRHADILICSGPVTLQSCRRLQRIYEQMPGPKYVVAVGGCAISGGAFYDCYNTLGGIDQALPVDVFVPGCPPRPEAIIHGLLTLLRRIADRAPQPEVERRT